MEPRANKNVHTHTCQNNTQVNKNTCVCWQHSKSVWAKLNGEREKSKHNNFMIDTYNNISNNNNNNGKHIHKILCHAHSLAYSFPLPYFIPLAIWWFKCNEWKKRGQKVYVCDVDMKREVSRIILCSHNGKFTIVCIVGVMPSPSIPPTPLTPWCIHSIFQMTIHTNHNALKSNSSNHNSLFRLNCSQRVCVFLVNS